jgi:hypothetical protein
MTIQTNLESWLEYSKFIFIFFDKYMSSTKDISWLLNLVLTSH